MICCGRIGLLHESFVHDDSREVMDVMKRIGKVGTFVINLF